VRGAQPPEAERELHGASEVWARAIEKTLNEVVCAADEPLFNFGRGVDYDLDLRTMGKGVAKHAETIMTALDHLSAPENAIKAAGHGILVRWPE
jgi:hypothetical protein